MISRFDHLTLVVSDLNTAVANYEALFGSPPRWRGTHPEHGTQTALFGLGNSLIELTAPLPDHEASVGLREFIAQHGEGLQALAFGSDDAAQCSSELRSRGLRCTPPQAGSARSDTGEAREYRVIELSAKATRGLPVLVVERPDAQQLMAAGALAPERVDMLDHVVVKTSDPAAALEFYAKGLGLRLALDRDLNGTRMLFFRVGGVTLEIVSDAGAGPRDSFYGAAYRVRDIQQAHARMAASGTSVSEIRAGRKPGTSVFSVLDRTCGVPTLIIRDPSRD